MGDHDSPSTCLSSRAHEGRILDSFLHYRGCLSERGFDKVEKHPLGKTTHQPREEFLQSLNSHKRKRVKREEQRILKLRALFDRKEEETGEFAAEFKKSLELWQIKFKQDRPNSNISKDQDKYDYTILASDTIDSIVTRCRSDEAALKLLNPSLDPSKLLAGQIIQTPHLVVDAPCRENGFGVDANMIFFKNSERHSDDSCPEEHFPNQRISIKDLLYNKDRTTNPLMRPCEENEIRYFHIPGNNMEWVEEAIARYFNEERPEYDGLFRRPPNPSKTDMLLRPQFWRGQQHGGRHDAVHARHMRPRCDIVSTDPTNLDSNTMKNLVLFMPYLHWETDRRRAKFDEYMRGITEKRLKEEALAEKSPLTFISAQVSNANSSATQLTTNGTTSNGQTQTSSVNTRGSSSLNRMNIAAQPSVTYAALIKGNLPTQRSSRLPLESNGDLTNMRDQSYPLSDFNTKSTKNSIPYATQPRAHQESVSHSFSRRPRDTNGDSKSTSVKIERVKSPESEFTMDRTATEAMEQKFRQEIADHPRSKFSNTAFARELVSQRLEPKSRLGRVLYHAALLSEAMDCYNEKRLLSTYLHNNPPFHPRRTLDQSYYWTLKTTKRRDRDQVVYRGTAPKKNKALCRCREAKEEKKEKYNGCKHLQENSRKMARVVMVDQLWLWILGGNTMITSFPKRYGRNKPDPSAVHKSIRTRLKVARVNEIRSVYDLAHIVLDECAKVFFDRTKSVDRKPQTMDLFASAIGNVTNKQTIAYDHFWHTSQEASNVYKTADTVGDIEDKAKSLLDINPEGVLLREIKDISDELDLMINIKDKQERVFKEFNKNVEYLIAHRLTLAKELGIAKPKEVTEGNTGSVHDANHQKVENDTRWTLECGEDIAADLRDRIADLHNLKDRAERTEKALDGLLALKQQQAGVVQAREAVRQAEETLRQGRAIMLFTVVTIIFLPMSLASSIFGMNNGEFNDTWHVRHQIMYMFSISIGVMTISFILAFSSFSRAGIHYLFEVSWIKLATSTGMYVWWLGFKNDSKEIHVRRKAKTRKWKEEAKAAKQKKDEEKHKRNEENEDALPVVRRTVRWTRWRPWKSGTAVTAEG